MEFTRLFWNKNLLKIILLPHELLIWAQKMLNCVQKTWGRQWRVLSETDKKRLGRTSCFKSGLVPSFFLWLGVQTRSVSRDICFSFFDFHDTDCGQHIQLFCQDFKRSSQKSFQKPILVIYGSMGIYFANLLRMYMLENGFDLRVEVVEIKYG